MITSECITNLKEIKELISSLENEQYAHSSILLSGSSVGQHVRHILEFYQAALIHQEPCVINYDGRKRDPEIEQNPQAAEACIDELILHLANAIEDYPVRLVGNYHVEDEHNTTLNTYLHRELAYCLEHSVHHQALIKIGLVELGMEDLIDENFGVAPATMRYKARLHVEA